MLTRPGPLIAFSRRVTISSDSSSDFLSSVSSPINTVTRSTSGSLLIHLTPTGGKMALMSNLLRFLLMSSRK